MTVNNSDVGDQALTFAQAIGLIDGDGNLDASWFEDPLGALADVLSDTEQRDSTVELLNLLLPETQGAPDGWRQIVAEDAFRVYLTTDSSGGSLTIGLGGRIDAPDGVRIDLEVPLIEAAGAGTDPQPVVGTAQGPIRVELHVPVNLAAPPVGLRAIEGSVELEFDPTVEVRPVVELIGLQLGAAPASDRRFDTDDLGGDVVDLVIGLLQDALDQPGVPPQIADHLLPLLGLGDAVGAIPELPILRLPAEPAALRDWIQTLVEGPGLGEWLGHLAGLLDAPPAVGGAGTRADPWRVALFHDTHVALEATAAVDDGRIWPGLEIRAGEDQATDTSGMHMVGQAVVMGLPYIGVGEAEVAPDVRFLVRSPAPLVDVGGGFSCRRLEAGVTWDGSDLVPMLQLLDVEIDGATHPRVDLTQTEEIAGLASDAVEAALRAMVGDGPGLQLLALAGVIPPSTAPAAWPHTLDLPRFLVDPLGAIGAYHRAVLQHGTHTWSALHAEIAALLGLAGVSGTGTESDPWRFALSAAGAIEIRIDAWRVSDGGTETLRLGLAVGFDQTPFQAIAVAQLVALEIPAAGGPTLEVGAKIAARLSIDPLPVPPDMGSFRIQASSIAGSVAWAPGSMIAWDVRIEDILVGLAGGGTPTFDLRFPTDALDFSDPAATAAGLGLDTAQLDAIVRGLVWRAARSWGGRDGQLLATLLGFGAGAWELPDDFPQLGGSAGTLLTDPLGSVRPWLLELVRAPGSDGVVPLAHLIHLLQAWAERHLPTDFEPFLDERVRSVAGSGTPDDPWRFDVDGSGALELCLWAGPEGPALPALPALSGGDADVIADIATKLRDGVAVLGAALESEDAAGLASGLEELEAFFEQSDGTVPVVSQQPEGWTTPAPFTAVHAALPTHADAITAIRQHVADQAGAPVTLLLSAPFADRTSWDALLSSAGLPGTTDAGAHFHLRVPDLPASGVDLTPVTAVADWYTADLDDAEDVASQEAQIGRILDRLSTLVPGRAVVLVAHSTTGNAARRVAAARADRVAGIVTLGTPHLGARPAWATGGPAGLALQTARTIATILPAGTLRDAIDAAIRAVDDAPDAPWTPAFFLPADTDTSVGAVPALAIAGRVGGGLLDAVEDAIRGLVPGDRTPPTHIGLCLRSELPTSFRTHDLGIRTTAEVDLGRIGLPGAAEGAIDPRLTVRVDVDGAGGWLVGGAGVAPDGTPWDVRCRRATLRLTVEDDGADFSVELVGASTGIPRMLDFEDPRASDVLDRIFERLSETPGAATFLDDLQAIGLAVPAPDGGIRLSTDAIEALRTNGLAWLRPRVQSAFTSGLNALPTDGLDLGVDLPVRVDILTAPARLRISTIDDGVELGDRARLNGHVDLGLPGGELSYRASIGFDGLTLAVEDGTVTVAAGSWMDPLTLLPADAAAFQSRIEEILPRLVFSAATTALGEATLPAGMRIGPLDRLFFGDDGSNGSNGSSEGAGGAGPLIPVDALVPLLRVLNGALGNPPGDTLELPSDLRLEVVDTGTATRVQLRTAAPLGGIVGVELGVDLTAGPSATPSASISVGIPDPAGGTLLDVAFSHGAAGTGLAIHPAGAPPITLLPSFSGFGSILAGGVALLPRALDELDDAIGAGAVKTAVLDVATELEIYSTPGGFAPHTARFQELLNGGWNRSATQQTALSAAVRAVVGQIPGLPGAVGGTGTELTWSVVAGGGATGTISLGLDWADDRPVFTAAVDDLGPAGSPVLVDVVLSVTPSGPTPFDVSVAVMITDLLGLPIRPTIEAGASPSGIVLSVLPLATLGDPGALEFVLLPDPDVQTQPDLGERVVVDVIFPLLLTLIDRATGTDPLWAGGPTVRDILRSAGLLDVGGSAVLPFPPPLEVFAGAVTALSATIPLGELDLVLGNVGGGLGVGANGKLEIPLDDLVLVLWFQSPDGWLTSPPAAAVRLILLQNDGGWRFRPRLDAEGLGIGLAGKEGGALITSDLFRLGSAQAHTFFGIAFDPWDADFDGAGVRLGGVGLPLNQLTGGGSNGVVSGLLSGGDASEGEPGGAQPALDIDLWYLDGDFHVEFNGELGPYWLAVQSSFGPLYIEQVGIGLMQQGGNTVGVDLLVDGGVSLAGLSVMVDDLTLGVPFRSLGRPQDWSIDLAGLAVSYDSSGVKIAGGLTKVGEGANVEYLGMLLVEVQSFGLVAIGAWGSMSDEEGDYTSFFVFAALFLTISFPPYLEIRGIGLGFGYNRRLVVPDDINAIPDFALVAALDSAGSFLENPMAALQAMRQQVPARRGSYWFAVGFHGTTFVVVHITAVVYVALDGGVEIGILGVARMMLPTADTALVSIELALKARYSSSEGLLSIQAQLTDNSWLLSRDCQLTGGFAFFMWFDKGQFLLTIGGYHPAFQREPEYPEVPRVGLRWDLGPIVIKGEAYFALTNSAVMAGISVEASYTLGSWLRVWFKAWADFLLQWDPFYYDISIGVSLGARLTFTINLLFGKVKITLSLELGAELRVFGPPLRGVVKAKLGPFEVTVAFGASADEPDYISWPAFRDKYVLSEDTTAAATGVAPGKGLLQPEEKDADPPTGLQNDPWRFNPDFGLRTETKMPASKWRGPFHEGPQSTSGVDDLDAVPMDAEDLTSLHVVEIERMVDGVWRSVVNREASNLQHLDIGRQVSIEVQLEAYPEAVWRRGEAVAASRNIHAIGSVRLAFASIAIGIPTAQIPITTLIDEGPRAPNPFTRRRGRHGVYRDLARQAVDLIQGAAFADSYRVAAAFLERGGLFDAEREALGLKSGGLDPRGLQSLARRTTPPSLGSLSTGLTMDPVVFEAPPVLEQRLSKAPIALQSARLRAHAVLPAAVARAAGTSLRTTVSMADDVPRVRPPSLKEGVAADTLGARLMRVPVAGSTPPTRAVRPAPGGASASTGRPTSKRRAARTEALEKTAGSDGLTLNPGDIQHWELPTHDRRWTLTLNGDSVGVRLLFLARGSRVIADSEHVLEGSVRFDLPEGSRQVVVIALGTVASTVASGMGAVSGAFTPGGVAALGWQADSTIFVATRSVLVARGARIRLGGPSRAEAGRTAIASRALTAKGVVETRFPARQGTVVVLADRVGSGTAAPPEVGIVGGTLSAPLRESNGRRDTWLYEVEPDDGHATMQVTVAFGTSWTPGGVVLVPGGSPAGVGARLNGDTVPRFVSDGPIAARGSLHMSLSSASRSEEE